MNKTEKLRELANEIVACKVCNDLASQATQLVMGFGNSNAKLVLIGEAPGAHEDREGRPFIGAAGKLLDKMLDNSGLAREDIYITNIVKYRPPKNRDPSPQEKAESWPYLLRELEIIDPVVIAPMGRHAMTYFLPNANISTAHGETFMYDKWKIMPLYHPAAALYNGSLRQTLFDDFDNLVQQLNMLKQ